MKRAYSLVGQTLVSLCAVLGVACSSDGSFGGGKGGSSSSNGGAAVQGGSGNANGGVTNANGGSSNANGGVTNTNGGSTNTSGGAVSGGAANGGSTSGGASSGGSTSGGSSNGGAANGGSGNGGSGNGGASAGNAGSGTGGSSAGANNGGASQSGGAGGKSSGGGTGAPVFQDDFEGSALNTKWVSKINGGGMFALDSAQKHGGSKSLHVTTNSGYSTLLAIEDSSVFPAPNNTFYGRVWLRVPTLPGNAHVIWIEAGDVTNDTHEVRIGMNLGYLQTNLYFNGEVDLRDPSATLAAATWECIEFKMGNDELVVWLNGTQSNAVSTTNWAQVGNGQNGGGQAKTNWSPTYKSFRIGWELNAGTEIWFDDVALGYSRIGCQ